MKKLKILAMVIILSIIALPPTSTIANDDVAAGNTILGIQDNEGIKPQDEALLQSKLIKLNPSAWTVADQYIVLLKVPKDLSIKSQIKAKSFRESKEKRQLMVKSMAKDITDKVNGKVLRTYSNAIQGFALELNSRQLKTLAKDKRVSLIEQVQYVEISQATESYGLDRIDQRSLPLNVTYNFNNNGTGVNAYIMDSGIHASHSDFGGRVNGGFTAFNDGFGTGDCLGHGTAVAGVVGSTTWGVAKNVNLIPVKIFDCSPFTPSDVILAGIDWLAVNAQFPAVVNMSFGGPITVETVPIRELAINNLINIGITVVTSAGNSDDDACNATPARIPDALTLASSDANDDRAFLSSFGSCVDLFAPGASIRTTSNQGNDTTVSGTSFAAPFAAGTAARCLQNNPSATPAVVRNAILNNATSGQLSGIGSGSPNKLLYTGFLDTNSALSVTLTGDASGLCGGSQEAFSFLATASGSASPYTFNWQVANPLSSSTTNPNYGYLAINGTVSISVEVMGNDCQTVTKSITVVSSCGGGGFQF